MMKILGVIPARGGSKGVPNKNIKILDGKPLIAYTIESSLRSEELDRIIVSTEDEEISKIAIQYGADVPFLRPKELSQDNTPTIDVLIDLVKKLIKKGEHYDTVCILQPTVPFRSTEDVSKAIKVFKGSSTDSLVSVKEVPDKYNPSWCFLENDSGYLQTATGEPTLITRRQNLSKAFYRDGSIYLVRTEILLEKESLYGENIGYTILDNKYYVNIDTFSDWDRAERMIKEWKQI